MPRLIALLLAAALALPALAIDRPFPANVLRGKFTPGYFPDITLNGKARQLSPSARIFNEDNRIEMPAAVRGTDLVVNYTVDSMGYIDRIWILTADEVAQKVPSAK
ncbi:hypothetical protein GTP46_11070 [Duganella sp. FT135W]|uniref:Uncharacterized protein n=1 Tax=Duganella flavida TaxID=2692175 RepID=A0A6L8K995_9BURK|nr:hypothetical protein [Duganella flavida]MYM23187.1 hypothetical protein [Duganella flavida]